MSDGKTQRGEAVAIVSGGLDSVTLAHWLHSEGWRLRLVCFNYGQRHVREIEFARRCAERLAAPIDVVDLSALTPLLSGSALTDEQIELPHGHYAAPNMAVTIVPNRNAIFLSVAYAAAVSSNAEVVATGVHAGDHFIYPDCRPEFVRAFEAMQKLAVEGCGHPDLRLSAPFVGKTKGDIVALGAALQVPFAETWSCYEGAETHCGRCGTCVERREAFEIAGVPDPTVYRS